MVIMLGTGDRVQYVLFVHYLDFWISSDRILSGCNE